METPGNRLRWVGVYRPNLASNYCSTKDLPILVLVEEYAHILQGNNVMPHNAQTTNQFLMADLEGIWSLDWHINHIVLCSTCEIIVQNPITIKLEELKHMLQEEWNNNLQHNLRCYCWTKHHALMMEMFC